MDDLGNNKMYVYGGVAFILVLLIACAGYFYTAASKGTPSTSTVKVSSYVESNMFTPFNENGSGNSTYLDRHEVSCPPNAGISKFNLELGPKTMRQNYTCLASGDIGATKETKKTPSNEWGGGNATYLDRHDVSCDKGTVINKFKLTRPNETQIAYSYDCASAKGLDNCENLTTAFDDDGGGNTAALSKHKVQCPENKILTRFHLTKGSEADKNKWRYEYTCCGQT